MDSKNEVPNDESLPTTDSEAFLRNGADVRICNQEGFLCKVRMKALIDLDPEEMYSLLTHPDNSAIFKPIDAVSVRKVSLDTPERREVYIEQTSTVGVLFFKRQFTTALNVIETPQELAASFDLAKEGVMSDFRGKWHLSRVSAEEYRGLVKERAKPQHWNHSLGNPGPGDKTLFTIDQDVAPAIAHKVPPWLHGLLRRICASAVNDIYHDMTVVAELRYRGLPMETILRSKVHGRGGLIRKVLCGPPEAAIEAGAIPGDMPDLPENGKLDGEKPEDEMAENEKLEDGKPTKAVGSYAVQVADGAVSDGE